jgi:hypothetical protein
MCNTVVREHVPNPVSKLSDKSLLWRWYEVVKWLSQQHLIDDVKMMDAALFIASINAVLGERELQIREYIPLSFQF